MQLIGQGPQLVKPGVVGVSGVQCCAEGGLCFLQAEGFQEISGGLAAGDLHGAQDGLGHHQLLLHLGQVFFIQQVLVDQCGERGGAQGRVITQGVQETVLLGLGQDPAHNGEHVLCPDTERGLADGVQEAVEGFQPASVRVRPGFYFLPGGLDGVVLGEDTQQFGCGRLGEFTDHGRVPSFAQQPLAHGPGTQVCESDQLDGAGRQFRPQGPRLLL